MVGDQGSISGNNLAEAAIALGLPVFPCNADKRPIIEGGFHAATTDPYVIRRIFSKPEARMIGVPTGRSSGLVVVDVDRHGEVDGTEWLEENANALPPTRTHETKSGGTHLLFRYPEGAEIRNSASKLAAGVDVRGEGGYVIFPPSPGYSIVVDEEPGEMPVWLLNACLKQEQKPVERMPERPTTEDRHVKYALTALDGEIAKVVRAVEGTRNQTLFNAALKLGNLVSMGLLERSLVVSELERAGRAAGLEPGETTKTVQSGLNHGEQRSREIEDRPLQHPAEEGSGAYEPTVELQKKRPKVKLPIRFFRDIRPTFQAQELVRGLLVERSAVVIYGDSNCGKTFFALDLGLHIATGMEWRDRAVRQGLVVYAALEGGIGFDSRVEAFRRENNITADIPFAAISVPLDLRTRDADTDLLIEAIGEAEDHYGMPVAVVFVDTLSRAMAGGNENASEDMGAVVANCDKVRATKKCAMVYVHHTGKDAARGARGHSLLRAAIDTEIEVSKSEFGSVRTARVVKQRDLECSGVFDFQLVSLEVGHNERGEAVTSCVVEHIDGTSGQRMERVNPAQKHALTILADLCVSRGASGFPEIPDGVPSVPAAWWRDAFQERAMPGASPEEKKKGFRRVADALVQIGRVGMVNGRVWVASANRGRFDQRQEDGDE